jgi:hypothetical protein
MSPKDPEARRQYNRAYRRRRRADVDRKEKELAYERELYQKRKADPEFAAKRRERNLQYKADHRVELAAKERDRLRKNFEIDPAGTREKQRATSAKSRAIHGHTEADRRHSRKNYQKSKNDPGHKAKNVANASAWAKAHPKRAYANSRASLTKRIAADVSVKIGLRLGERLRSALRKNRGVARAVENLGCSLDFFRGHLEAQFQPGMTWGNWSRSGWHIDHILPLASFDLTDPVQVAIACHYSNLQPLWAGENISKGAQRNWRPGKFAPERWAPCYAAALAIEGPAVA